jgi:hypothetical protein
MRRSSFASSPSLLPNISSFRVVENFVSCLNLQQHINMKNRSDSSLSSLSSLSASPPDPFKQKPIGVTIDHNYNIENVQLPSPSPAMARRHQEGEPTEPREKKSTYGPFALSPRYEPTAAVSSNVRGDSMNNPSSRKRARNIDPADDYPVPQFDNMLIPPKNQLYKRKLSGRTTGMLPHQHWNQLTSGMNKEHRQRYSDGIDQRRHKKKNALEVVESLNRSPRQRE